MDLKNYVATIENYPKEGILFRDITPLMNDGKAYKYATEKIVEFAKEHHVDIVVGPEARGFIFGCPVSYALGIGFAPVRKPGKLPGEIKSLSYDLEYGQSTIEIHEDSLNKGDKVVIVDDLIATGGSAKACTKLVESLGGEIVCLEFLIELTSLKAREELKDYKVISLIEYDH